MFLERRRTTVYTDGDAASFVDELHRRWTEQYGSLPPPVLADETPVADAFKPASVFLSYASEDLEPAQQVAAALDEAGVDVWFDRERLEALRPERLPRQTAPNTLGTPKRVRACCTASPCSTASSRSLDADTPGRDGAVSSSLPSLGYMRNTDLSGRWQSISSNHAGSDYLVDHSSNWLGTGSPEDLFEPGKQFRPFLPLGE
jgi:hypothetical protein